jgi:transcriptional regulator with XRE-family HTH domain
MLTGATLRALRERAGLSQRRVAERVGITASVLSAYERERREPGLEIAGRIIEATGCRVRFDTALDPAVQAERLVQVLELAEALPSRRRPLAHAMIQKGHA